MIKTVTLTVIDSKLRLLRSLRGLFKQKLIFLSQHVDGRPWRRCTPKVSYVTTKRFYRGRSKRPIGYFEMFGAHRSKIHNVCISNMIYLKLKVAFPVVPMVVLSFAIMVGKMNLCPPCQLFPWWRKLTESNWVLLIFV